MVKLTCPYGCGILNSELECPTGHRFDRNNGIYYLHKNDESWNECNQEACGTIDLLKTDGNYHEEKPQDIDKYPYSEVRIHGVDINRVMFDMCKYFIGGRRGSVLEIGAKNCWAVNQFTKMGFSNVVATDITDDVSTALGFGGRLIEFTGRHFDRIVCDGAYLPFDSEQFDVVFMCSTLHHIREKQKAMNEIYRVLKPNGVFVGMGDNPRHPDRSLEVAMAPVKREREQFHINETQPTFEEYYDFFDKANFKDYYFYPFDENLLKDNWIFGKSDMIEEILARSISMFSHNSFRDLFERLSKKTQSMFTLERFLMMNYWMYTPNNTVMYALK